MATDSAHDAKVERLRERYRELLEELRTIIPGSQVLFAFLLTAPFSARFEELDDFGRNVFVLVLLGVAAATVFFMAPAAFHRISSRPYRRTRLRYAIRFAITGMVLLAASMSGAVFVVTRFIFDDVAWAGAAAGAAVATLTAVLWYLLPRARSRRSPE
ncbi:DUF6328 family protein [Demequina aestuarii]|uniref:DUF6328 family protein n=1 Tax=Demequina aestuarii TaxID=327095 RepID=UPI000786794D|nr:DUF6328 family protein [Demequina aestuarii]